MEFFGVCIIISTAVACLTVFGVAQMCKQSFDTWIRTTDGWQAHWLLPVEKN